MNTQTRDVFEGLGVSEEGIIEEVLGPPLIGNKTKVCKQGSSVTGKLICVWKKVDKIMITVEEDDGTNKDHNSNGWRVIDV